MGQSVLNSGISRRDGVLHLDGISLEYLAESFGTPTYVYSLSVIRKKYRELEQALSSALGDTPFRIHYSVKANSNGSVLRCLKQLGSGVDIVSGGELHRAIKAGFQGSDVVFSGVGKTVEELSQALECGVRFLNVESEPELYLINQLASERGIIASVMLRVNPEVSVDNPHEYIRTGERGNKFGIPYDDAERVGLLAHSLSNTRLSGLDMHIGSQISSMQPYSNAIERIYPLIETLRAKGVDTIEWLDIGGGLGITYGEELAMDVESFSKGVALAAANLSCSLIIEPGRFIVAESGLLLSRVLHRKTSGGKEYIVSDAGMNDFVRPSHYQAFHRIDEVIESAANTAEIVADVVGPVCESGDFMALARTLPDMQAGDFFVVHTTGAYGYSMASNYNSRLRPAEVVVDGDMFAITTEREIVEDLCRLEKTELQWRSE